VSISLPFTFSGVQMNFWRKTHTCKSIQHTRNPRNAKVEVKGAKEIQATLGFGINKRRRTLQVHLFSYKVHVLLPETILFLPEFWLGWLIQIMGRQ